jgi:hypothetical protein
MKDIMLIGLIQPLKLQKNLNFEENFDLKYRNFSGFVYGKNLQQDTVSFSANKNLKTGETKLTHIERINLNKNLEQIERQGIKFFLDNRLPNGLVLDRVPNSSIPPTGRATEMCSIAATGYGLTAIVLASEKNMLPKKQAKEKIMQTLTFIDEHTPKINGGWLAHFADAKTGKTYKNTEISSIDTAIFFFNAFAAAEYFGGDVKKQVAKMYNKIDFKMMLTQDNQKPDQLAFNLGFHVKDGKREFIPHKWDEYSEGILVMLLGLGSPQVPDEIWSKGWNRNKKWEQDGLKNFVCLPLFTYFYPHGFLDLKDKVDINGDNFWKASQNAVKMQVGYCKDHGYPEGIFGITACDGPNGYEAYQTAGTEQYPAHDGTIAPPAILSCLPFAEKETLKAFEYIKKQNLNKEKYGLCNAYNVRSGWKTSDALGIDIGSMLLMLNSHNSGLIHKLVNKNEIVQKAMQRAGFRPENQKA